MQDHHFQKDVEHHLLAFYLSGSTETKEIQKHESKEP